MAAGPRTKSAAVMGNRTLGCDSLYMWPGWVCLSRRVSAVGGACNVIRLHLNRTLQAKDDLNLLCVIIVHHYYCVSL